ncbi:uncharacterized protein KRP23_1584 [Phytophthora ramorum]|uniref:uncharacterized protein n=1 Tax=Phytophthora ramorum TaxID=164328 RepID=UPI0030A289C4|nr:hypothetical protein KRP23_1584 [Phytophthora ramorum]
MADAAIGDPSFPVTTMPGSPSSRQVHEAPTPAALLERLAGADTIAYTFRELNSRLDAICVGIEYATTDQWMADWSHGCEVQAQQLESLVTGTAARMLIRDMASEQKVTTAMLEMYTWLEGNTPGPLPDLKRATLERLRVALDLEARVITSETVAGIQGQPDNILSIFRWFIPERDVEVNEGGLIGAGTYGTVDYGTWRRRDGTIQDVVIKSMFDRSIDSELAFLRQLQLCGAPYEQPDKTFDDEEWNVISRLIAVDIEDRPDMGEAVNLIAKLVLLPATGA